MFNWDGATWCSGENHAPKVRTQGFTPSSGSAINIYVTLSDSVSPRSTQLISKKREVLPGLKLSSAVLRHSWTSIRVQTLAFLLDSAWRVGACWKSSSVSLTHVCTVESRERACWVMQRIHPEAEGHGQAASHSMLFQVTRKSLWKLVLRILVS